MKPLSPMMDFDNFNHVNKEKILISEIQQIKCNRNYRSKWRHAGRAASSNITPPVGPRGKMYKPNELRTALILYNLTLFQLNI